MLTMWHTHRHWLPCPVSQRPACDTVNLTDSHTAACLNCNRCVTVNLLVQCTVTTGSLDLKNCVQSTAIWTQEIRKCAHDVSVFFSFFNFSYLSPQPLSRGSQSCQLINWLICSPHFFTVFTTAASENSWACSIQSFNICFNIILPLKFGSRKRLLFFRVIILHTMCVEWWCGCWSVF